MGDYYCPNCGADLEEQSGFDPDEGYWTCKECGKLLMDPDEDDNDSRYDDVGWFCDECGAYLNKQSGFSDWLDEWKCTECGHYNSLSEDDIYESEEEYSRSKEEGSSGGSIMGSILAGAITGVFDVLTGNIDEEDDDDEDDEEDDDNSFSSTVNNTDHERSSGETGFYHYTNPYRDSFEKDPISPQNEMKKEDKTPPKGFVVEKRVNPPKGSKKLLWSIIGKKIPVGIDYSDCLGASYSDIIERFHADGFINITVVDLNNLGADETSGEGTVANVSINGDNQFEKGDRYAYNKYIRIYVNTIKMDYPPFRSKEARKYDKSTVEWEFQRVGFTNTETVGVPDLVTGWVTKEGTVKSVSINGIQKYRDNERIRVDSKVVIEYHTFKRK